MGVAETLKSIAARLTRATSTVVDEIARLRAAIVEKRRELAAARYAPLPPEEIEPRIRDQVATTATLWLREWGTSVVMGERGLGAPDLKGFATLPWGYQDGIHWGALCAAQPDLAAELLRGIVRQVAYTPGPPLAERPSTVARLEAELAERERTEEGAVDACNEAGVRMEHRSEVVQRRAAEASRREQGEREVAHRRSREEAIDQRHAAEAPRSRLIVLDPDARTGAHGSGYISAGQSRVPPVEG